ncbi:MAG: YcgJ family protein [Alphaproteobacteria bacterium]|nr:YcgJ family protein [Alphaproteobacteria bacterium]
MVLLDKPNAGMGDNMKKIVIGSLVLVAAFSPAAFAGQVEYGSGVFSPEKGVICDREGNFCADGTGISASWTEQYLGAEAAHNIANADQSEWVYHNGVECILAAQACNHHGKVDKSSKKIQEMLFGK